MAALTATATVELPAPVVFEYASDYRRMPEWMFGLHSIEPIGNRSTGVGARFRGTGKLGPVTLDGTVRITDWEPGHSLTATSSTSSGITVAGTFVAHPTGPTLTRIEVTSVYRFPGGIAGKVLQRSLEPLVGLAIRQSERGFRRQFLPAD